MSVRPTLQIGDPALRAPSGPVADPGSPEIAALTADLADTLADWRARTTYGRGIAAPQIGAPLRVVYLDLGEPWVLINPRITGRSAATWRPWDTCLSFSVAFFAEAERARRIEVAWTTTDGEHRELRADGDLAELLQHEIDHLDGVLAVDRMAETGAMCMRAEFERRHRDTSPYRA
jgi:peptide deformylase